MITFLMVIFCCLCLFLVLFILIQQGKGDMGLGSIGRGSQELFGGSGGQDFFQKTTWVMGSIFMISALGLAIYKTTIQDSRIKGYQSPLALEKATKQGEKKSNNNTVALPKTSPVRPAQEKK